MQIAIIGGGASGVLAAVALLRDATTADQITHIEPTAVGTGIAYATTNERLLLNVRAYNMSAYADQPGHFVAWLDQAHPGNDADAFVPRRWYAVYLRETLAQAIAASAGQYQHLPTLVTDIVPRPHGAQVTLADGTLPQALAAASLAMQSMLGLICDPVANRVEVPCLGKNVMAAANSMACANMALAGFAEVIPFDEVVATAKRVAEQMPRELRCTTLGGLSITPTSLAIEARLAARKAAACGSGGCGCG